MGRTGGEMRCHSCGSHPGDLTRGGITLEGSHTERGHRRKSHLGITSGGITPGEVIPVGHHITVLLRVWRDAQQGSPKSRVTPGCL